MPRKTKMSRRTSEEIEKLTANKKDLSPRTKYAMNMIGLKYSDIAPRELDFFDGDDDEQQIQRDFYNQQRANLLNDLVIARQKVIDNRLCDQSALDQFEEEHLKKLLSEEDKKLQKIFARQDRETKRLLNDQLNSMNQQQKQIEAQSAETEREKRKQQEILLKQQEKLKKKQQIIERRKQAELQQREIERKRYLEALRKQEENDQKLIIEQQKKERHRQSLLIKRVKEFKQKEIEKQKKKQLISLKQTQKMNDLANRYYKENNRYLHNVKTKIKTTKESYNKRKERHSIQHSVYKKELNQKHKHLLKKQENDEKRIKQFQIKKKNELQRKKLERETKIKKTLNNAKGGEEERLQKIFDAVEKAEENRKAFFAKKLREDNLKRLVATLKKEAARKSATRKNRANLFKNECLMNKNQREDERRYKDLNLKETLRQQRIINDTSVKLRQDQIKEEIMLANKNGDMAKLKQLMCELENQKATNAATTMHTSPKKKNKKINVILSPKKLDSSIAKTIHVTESKIKASVLRGNM